MKNLIKILGIFLILATVTQAKFAYADWDDHHRGDPHFYRYHDRPHFGLHVSFIPETSTSVWIGGSRYYYDDGLYYTSLNGDYVIVSPPIGAFVRNIPPDYHAVVINGITYYTDSGTYYVYTRNGYQVVPPPAIVVQAAPVVIDQPVVTTQTTTVSSPAPQAVPAVFDSVDSYTLNIPSDKGGYTSVVIKKQGNGFVGPQGEFYPEFPKISQLKAMYAK